MDDVQCLASLVNEVKNDKLLSFLLGVSLLSIGSVLVFRALDNHQE